MRFILSLVFISVPFSAYASPNCSATLFKQGISIKSNLQITKDDGQIAILTTEIQDRVFQVGYSANKKTYVLSISDSKTNQKNETTLINVNPEQEKGGITLSGGQLKGGDGTDERTLLVCTK